MALSGAASEQEVPVGLLPAIRILLVEDEALVRTSVAASLEDEGFEVLEAETVARALDLLRERPVDVLFTDIRLPGGLDGWDLAEAARALRPDLPVIYATGYSADAPRLVQGSVFLRKPYLPSAVIRTIRTLLQRS